jgi:LysM repeat protein
MKKLIFTGLLFLTAATAFAQDVLTPVQYVELYKDFAVREMKRMGVPAAITLAQGILETESGNSILVKKSNNHFGIKCKSNWTGGSVTHDDDAVGECFRQYKTAEESYRDHSNFLRNNSRYGFLFKIDVKDYKAWAYGLKKAGYATNPRYPQILIKQIEQYNLQQYTLLAAEEIPNFNAGNYQDDKEAKVTDEKIIAEEKNQTPDESILDISDNVVTVNGSKCVYAGKGTSLLVVATKNNIALSKLLSFNELAEDGMLTKDQFVYLQKKSKTGESDFYKVSDGESLYDIAQKNGIQLQYMLDYNKLWGNEDVEAGRKIYLKPGLIPAKNETAIIKAAVNVKIHTVQAKEGLYAIAKKYNLSVQQLKEWNKLQANSLNVGQQLIIAQ